MQEDKDVRDENDEHWVIGGIRPHVRKVMSSI